MPTIFSIHPQENQLFVFSSYSSSPAHHHPHSRNLPRMTCSSNASQRGVLPPIQGRSPPVYDTTIKNKNKYTKIIQADLMLGSWIDFIDSTCDTRQRACATICFFLPFQANTDCRYRLSSYGKRRKEQIFDVIKNILANPPPSLFTTFFFCPSFEPH
jgi:hypothetical protein